ncbi:MAG TPA: family 65 glycosyl hydrolase [Lentisphaeria bacterium]|nr:MAG: glycoside hydrolase [Lentisphaerae bacterium GWF2_49_21]HBC86155.1 family 65 glycosyl hydrolase [Lentisphaeria bacterium]
MTKIAKKFLSTDPWIIEEKGFQPEHAKVAESIFSLGNEFMGVRGYFEEGCSVDRFVGSFFNGIFEEEPINHPVCYNGFPKRFHFMLNSVDWLYTRIRTEKEELDLGKCRFSHFVRSLDLREGVLRRSFIWHAAEGDIRIEFERVLSMVEPHLGIQRIILTSMGFTGKAEVKLGLDFSNFQHNRNKCFWSTIRKEHDGDVAAIMARTLKSAQKVFSSMKIKSPAKSESCNETGDQIISRSFKLNLKNNEKASFDRIAVNFTDKKALKDDDFWNRSMKSAMELNCATYEKVRAEHVACWKKIWSEQDIEIEGDPENQQGVRFGIFQLHQTYHGVDPSLNVSAKGLTGEEYHGHTWWDTETYCLPFYIFNNPAAAKNLLEYRYLTLPQAKQRAIEKGCKGARYPMETIDGTEACSVWQHGDLEIHVPVAVAYGIWHYSHLVKDKDFLYGHGIEMLVEISRYYASRGGWAQLTGEYGFWCVMGPDEFHMMSHNNCYTNFMVKKSFEYTLSVLEEMKKAAPVKLDAIVKKLDLKKEEMKGWMKMAERMRVPQDKKTGVYEQHDGYFDMPHLEVDKIKPEEFPLYHNWAYYKLFRTDMIKQPDAMLILFFYSQEFSDKVKKANFEFYEPRCSHESSLSPGVHSIMAAELGLNNKAYSYWGHAARLDLDDYNNNTNQGLHTTSMAAAWMNVVYGFGGLRTDGECLSFRPSLPKKWKSFKFSLRYLGRILNVRIDRKVVRLEIGGKGAIKVEVFDKSYSIGDKPLEVKMPKSRMA